MCPLILSCSLETRLVPRYRVIEALNSMGLSKKPRSFPFSIRSTEENFLKKYIDSYGESLVLHNIYRGVQGSEQHMVSGCTQDNICKAAQA